MVFLMSKYQSRVEDLLKIFSNDNFENIYSNLFHSRKEEIWNVSSSKTFSDDMYVLHMVYNELLEKKKLGSDFFYKLAEQHNIQLISVFDFHLIKDLIEKVDTLNPEDRGKFINFIEYFDYLVFEAACKNGTLIEVQDFYEKISILRNGEGIVFGRDFKRSIAWTFKDWPNTEFIEWAISKSNGKFKNGQFCAELGDTIMPNLIKSGNIKNITEILQSKYFQDVTAPLAFLCNKEILGVNYICYPIILSFQTKNPEIIKCVLSFLSDTPREEALDNVLKYAMNHDDINLFEDCFKYFNPDNQPDFIEKLLPKFVNFQHDKNAAKYLGLLIKKAKDLGCNLNSIVEDNKLLSNVIEFGTIEDIKWYFEVVLDNVAYNYANRESAKKELITKALFGEDINNTTFPLIHKALARFDNNIVNYILDLKKKYCSEVKVELKKVFGNAFARDKQYTLYSIKKVYDSCLNGNETEDIKNYNLKVEYRVFTQHEVLYEWNSWMRLAKKFYQDKGIDVLEILSQLHILAGIKNDIFLSEAEEFINIYASTIKMMHDFGLPLTYDNLQRVINEDIKNLTRTKMLMDKADNHEVLPNEIKSLINEYVYGISFDKYLQIVKCAKNDMLNYAIKSIPSQMQKYRASKSGNFEYLGNLELVSQVIDCPSIQICRYLGKDIGKFKPLVQLRKIDLDVFNVLLLKKYIGNDDSQNILNGNILTKMLWDENLVNLIPSFLDLLLNDPDFKDIAINLINQDLEIVDANNNIIEITNFAIEIEKYRLTKDEQDLMIIDEEIIFSSELIKNKINEHLRTRSSEMVRIFVETDRQRQEVERQRQETERIAREEAARRATPPVNPPVPPAPADPANPPQVDTVKFRGFGSKGKKLKDNPAKRDVVKHFFKQYQAVIWTVGLVLGCAFAGIAAFMGAAGLVIGGAMGAGVAVTRFVGGIKAASKAGRLNFGEVMKSIGDMVFLGHNLGIDKATEAKLKNTDITIEKAKDRKGWRAKATSKQNNGRNF